MIFWLVGTALGLVALGLFLYWALVITEGAYLGRRVVALLYDWTPGYYDRIKEITWKRDDECLVDPLLEWMEGVQRPLILDVGAGTGRFPKAMLADERFDGHDLGAGPVHRHAAQGPRAGGSIWRALHVDLGGRGRAALSRREFDAVVCLEALEFTPSPERTLDELMRVLRPGGVLLLTNRIGRARWFPGRTYDDDGIVELLVRYPLLRIEIHSWNTFYDQVWVRKFGVLVRGRAGRGRPRGLAGWMQRRTVSKRALSSPRNGQMGQGRRMCRACRRSDAGHRIG